MYYSIDPKTCSFYNTAAYSMNNSVEYCNLFNNNGYFLYEYYLLTKYAGGICM